MVAMSEMIQAGHGFAIRDSEAEFDAETGELSGYSEAVTDSSRDSMLEMLESQFPEVVGLFEDREYGKILKILNVADYESGGKFYGVIRRFQSYLSGGERGRASGADAIVPTYGAHSVVTYNGRTWHGEWESSYTDRWALGSIEGVVESESDQWDRLPRLMLENPDPAEYLAQLDPYTQNQLYGPVMRWIPDDPEKPDGTGHWEPVKRRNGKTLYQNDRFCMPYWARKATSPEVMEREHEYARLVRYIAKVDGRMLQRVQRRLWERYNGNRAAVRENRAAPLWLTWKQANSLNRLILRRMGIVARKPAKEG